MVSQEDIGDELDKLALRILELMQSYIDCKFKLEQTMKNGFLNIAKSRYIMGVSKISRLQLPTEDSPEFKAVSLVSSSYDETLGHHIFCLNEKEGTSSSATYRNSKSSDRSPINSGTITSTSGTNKSDLQVVDPIKWFGVLVPQNLKQSQTNFKSAIELTVECSTIQSELNTVLVKYEEKRKKLKQTKHVVDTVEAEFQLSKVHLS